MSFRGIKQLAEMKGNPVLWLLKAAAYVGDNMYQYVAVVSSTKNVKLEINMWVFVDYTCI